MPSRARRSPIQEHRRRRLSGKNIMRKTRPRQKGQALVETGLILFVFIALLAGTLDFGQYLYFHQSLSQRARAALRYGIINTTDRTGIQNMALYNNPTATAH